MNSPAIFPFGFLREHLSREIARCGGRFEEGLASEAGKMIAIGVPGADEDFESAASVANELPRLSGAILFTGFSFEGNARARATSAIEAMLRERGIPVHKVDEQFAASKVGAGWRDLKMSEVFQRISATLLDEAAMRPW